MTSKKKVVVLGASGFVGTTLCERLMQDHAVELVPVIHSAGSAWRLARFGRPLTQLDVCDSAALRNAMRSATHVVNCTRGPRRVMIDGLAQMLEACRAEGVPRFVHLSSVMVYGDPPHPDSHHEEAPTHPPPGADSYGMMKLEQDRMVQAAVAQGLKAVVLCPPNISGPYSGYLAGIVDAMRKGTFALVDDGAGPCNLVDVRNLCHAIELALDAPDSACDGNRMFVTDGDAITWAGLVAQLRELAAVDEVDRIGRAELARRVEQSTDAKPPSIGAALRHLVSSDVRAALRKDPLLARLDRSARIGVTRMGRKVESRLRRSIEGPLTVRRPDPYAALAVGLVSQQLRTVRHANDRVERTLQFAPLVGFERSMADFRAWYRSAHGLDTPFADLTTLLYPVR